MSELPKFAPGSSPAPPAPLRMSFHTLMAMSTDGAGDRSLRAPATPSSTQRPIDASMWLHASHTVNTVRGRSNVRPPSNERIIWICPGAAPVALNPNWNVNT